VDGDTSKLSDQLQGSKARPGPESAAAVAVCGWEPAACLSSPYRSSYSTACAWLLYLLWPSLWLAVD